MTPQPEAVSAGLAEYGGTDLLCYRADAPEDLCRRVALDVADALTWDVEHPHLYTLTTTLLRAAGDAALDAARKLRPQYLMDGELQLAPGRIRFDRPAQQA